MNPEWIPIRYREFYDFPRAFVVQRGGELLFFDCPFDDGIDDYPSEFTVYRLASERAAAIDSVPWTDLPKGAEVIGTVATTAVTFDETRRQSIRSDIFTLIG